MRVLGAVLIALGLVLLFFGYNASESVADQVSETLTGRFTQETMNYMIAGVVCLAAGAAMLVFGRR